jgi:hypothetical protein
MVVHGESIDLGKAEGWYACEDNEIIGLVTYRITGNEMEILSLDSLVENKGTGTALLHKAISEARNAGLERIRLITTNDTTKYLKSKPISFLQAEERCSSRDTAAAMASGQLSKRLQKPKMLMRMWYMSALMSPQRNAAGPLRNGACLFLPLKMQPKLTARSSV